MDETVSSPILSGDVIFDPFKKLNEKQMASFNKLRSNLSDLTDQEDITYCTDMCLLRYLRARDYTVSKSEKLLRNSLEWRKKNKPQDVKITDVPEIAKTGCLYVNGKDKQGRPIIFARPRKDTLKHVPGSEKFKHLVYWLETGFNAMDEPRGVETFCFVVDYNGFSRKNLDMNTNLESMHFLLDHCPERMGKSFFLDPPTLFWFAWKVISPFLNEVTLSKVKFCYSKKVDGKRIYPDLLEYIDADQLESSLGGNNPNSFDYETYVKSMMTNHQNQQPITNIINNNNNVNNNNDIQQEESETSTTSTSSSPSSISNLSPSNNNQIIEPLKELTI